MQLISFAESFQLKVKRDGCGDRIIPGKHGHIGDGYANELLGVYLSFDTVRQWHSRRKQLLSLGARLKQNGDTDGVLLFQPEDKPLARLAIRLAGIKRRKSALPPSPKQLAARLAFAHRQRDLLRSSFEAPPNKTATSEPN